jgi:hypothetical protein
MVALTALIPTYNSAAIRMPFAARLIRHNNGFLRAKLARQ